MIEKKTALVIILLGVFGFFSALIAFEAIRTYCIEIGFLRMP